MGARRKVAEREYHPQCAACTSQMRKQRLAGRDPPPSLPLTLTLHDRDVTLEREGLVNRRRGAGTFVAPPKIHFNKLTSFTEQMASRSLTACSKVLSFSLVNNRRPCVLIRPHSADEEMDATAAAPAPANLLKVPRDAPLLRIRQVIQLHFMCSASIDRIGTSVSPKIPVQKISVKLSCLRRSGGYREATTGNISSTSTLVG